MECKKLFVFITLWFILGCDELNRTGSDAFEGPRRRNYRRRRRFERRDDAFSGFRLKEELARRVQFGTILF